MSEHPQEQNHIRVEGGAALFVTIQTGLYLQKDDKTVAVANFYPELLDYAQLTGAAGTDEFRFRIQWIGVSGISVTGWYTMADLEKLNFSSLHPLFAVEPRRRRAMPDYIRGQLSQQTPRTVHRVSATGWNRVGDTFFYAAGGQLVFAKGGEDQESRVWLSSDVKKQYAPLRVSLEEKDAARLYLMLLQSIPDISEVLCLCTILGFSRQLFNDAGALPEFWLWILGKSGYGKTGVAQQLTTIFRSPSQNLPAAKISLTGTAQGILQAAKRFKDVTLIFDDKCLADTKSTMHAQERVLDDLIRITTNNTPRKTMTKASQSESEPFTDFIIGTAEYLPRAASLLQRSLVIELQRSVDFSRSNEILSAYPGTLDSFFVHFLRFYAEHYSDTTAQIEQSFRAFKQKNSKAARSVRRVDQHCFFLLWAKKLLLEYIETLGIMEDAQLTRLSDRLQRVIQNLNASHRARILESRDDEELTIPALFWRYHRSLSVSRSYAPGVQAYQDGTFLCIRLEALTAWLQKTIPSRSFIPREVSKEFRREGLLLMDDSKSLKATCKRRTNL